MVILCITCSLELSTESKIKTLIFTVKSILYVLTFNFIQYLSFKTPWRDVDQRKKLAKINSKTNKNYIKLFYSLMSYFSASLFCTETEIILVFDRGIIESVLLFHFVPRNVSIHELSCISFVREHWLKDILMISVTYA